VLATTGSRDPPLLACAHCVLVHHTCSTGRLHAQKAGRLHAQKAATTTAPPYPCSYAIAYASAYTAGSVQGGEGCIGQAEAQAKSQVQAHAQVSWAGAAGLLVYRCNGARFGLNCKLGAARLGICGGLRSYIGSLEC